jgi:hypothetical protein
MSRTRASKVGETRRANITHVQTSARDRSAKSGGHAKPLHSKTVQIRTMARVMAGSLRPGQEQQDARQS